MLYCPNVQMLMPTTLRSLLCHMTPRVMANSVIKETSQQFVLDLLPTLVSALCCPYLKLFDPH